MVMISGLSYLICSMSAECTARVLKIVFFYLFEELTFGHLVSLLWSLPMAMLRFQSILQ